MQACAVVLAGFLGLLAAGNAEEAADVPPPPPQEVTLEKYGPPDPPALHKGCDAGKLENCVYLALLYERGEPGDGVERDPEQVHTLWIRVAELSQKSCNEGDTQGCAELGRSYWLGRGGPKDPARAAELFGRACEARDALSCFVLGRQIERGNGATADAARAQALYQAACEGGFPPGCAEAKRLGGT